MDEWTAAIEAAQKHVKLGQSLQARGMTILNSLPVTADSRAVDWDKIDPATLAKLTQNATRAIDSGVRIERDALDKLIGLEARRPQWS